MHPVDSLPAAAVAGVPYFGVPSVLPPLDAPCRWCCHWSLPIGLAPRRSSAGPIVPLLYEEWLIWRWHVVHHQGGAPLA